ncbi:MAG: sulfurtransferase-like selenium metabolism protein YedF [Candidatus Eremiobacterota bacterium]
MQIIDATGKACPQPVIMTKDALLSEEQITVIVDNPISRDNVERFAISQGCSVTIQGKDNLFHLIITKGSQAISDIKTSEIIDCQTGSTGKKGGTLFYIASDQTGIGAEELGHILMRAFIKTIIDLDEKPEKIIFLNSGVKLSCKGSKVIEDLKELEKSGIKILSCGTCLDFYGLKEDLAAGTISNMYEILSALQDAEKVIRP